MKPSTEELLTHIAQVYHHLTTQKKVLSQLWDAKKYDHLRTEAGKLLKRAGYLGAPPAVMPESKYVKRGDVARVLDVSPDTVRNWLRSGRIPCFRTPSGRFSISRVWLEGEKARLAAERQRTELQAK